MNKDEIKKRVKELSLKEEWNHFYVFPGGVKTRNKHIQSPGYNINKWKRLKPIMESLDVSGKSMIDVGCSDGFFSIQCASMGMKHVLGTDLDPLRIDRANFAKLVYGIKNVDFGILDLYKVGEVKSFDIVLGLGLIHRVPDIELCLDKLCKIGFTMVLEFKTLNKDANMCEYHGGRSKSNKYNGLHYTPTKKYMIHGMKERGFPYYKFFDDDNSGLNYKRTIAIFSKGEL